MDLRAGRFDGQMTDDAAVFSSSIEFDRRLFESDIKCNRAHTTMLIEQEIIPEESGRGISYSTFSAIDCFENGIRKKNS